MTPSQQKVAQHLGDHAARISARLGALGQGRSALGAAVGLVESVVEQALALGKTGHHGSRPSWASRPAAHVA
jgi:hypothetical protein